MKPQVLVAAVLVGVPALTMAAAESGQYGRAQRREQIRFQAMDQNRDGVISRAEWRGSRQSFDVHDWNNDGMLSGDEVRVGVWRPSDQDEDYDQTRRPQFRNWTAAGFANLDRNRDGRITRAEWFYDREGFVRADRNGDGVLARSEFLGVDVDDDREDRFEYLDTNNNGRIDQAEWHASDAAFRWLDRNSDGVLGRDEVVGDEIEPSDLFAGLDVNSDDVVTSNEWQWSRRSFARQDRNGDGQLSRSELTNAELSAAVERPVGTSGQSVVVAGSEGWVDAGIDVRNGSTVMIEAQGSMILSDNPADVAEPDGSRSGRLAPSAPIPNVPAGALIARIGNSPAMLVGARQVITANRSGRLYLAVNDDHFSDNRGQYRVDVSIRRR
jgi:Ca2+-binding EF-hand superfamily protein